MTQLVSELNSLDFASYIGGPMQAAIDAQNSAALAQVEFIKNVGLEQIGSTGTNNPTKERVRMVTFNYETLEDDQKTLKRTLSVPFLTMLTIPSIRIEEMTIDFNVRLNSVETKEVSSDLKVDASASLSYLKRINFKASASYQRNSKSTSNVERTYSMNVHVKVVNDEMPAGTERLLDILEDYITASSVSETK